MRVIPSLSPRRWLSPYNNRVGLDIALFRGLHGVHLRCGLPARRAANLARCLKGIDAFVTSPPLRTDSYWLEGPVAARESHALKIRAISRRTAIARPVCTATGSAILVSRPDLCAPAAGPYHEYAAPQQQARHQRAQQQCETEGITDPRFVLVQGADDL